MKKGLFSSGQVGNGGVIFPDTPVHVTRYHSTPKTSEYRKMAETSQYRCDTWGHLTTPPPRQAPTGILWYFFVPLDVGGFCVFLN